MENTQFRNIETLAQDLLIHRPQQDSRKEENQELLDLEIILERNKVWQKMVNTFFQDSKTVNAEPSDKHKEIHGELKREEVTQGLVITEFHLILVTMSPEKQIKEEWLRLLIRADDQEEVPFVQGDQINHYLIKKVKNKNKITKNSNHHYKKNDLKSKPFFHV